MGNKNENGENLGDSQFNNFHIELIILSEFSTVFLKIFFKMGLNPALTKMVILMQIVKFYPFICRDFQI